MTTTNLLRSVTLLSALAISLNAAAQNLQMNVPIDTNWRAIGPVGDLTGLGIANVGLEWEAANPGWNSSLAFDDSDAAGWTNAILVVHPNPPTTRFWVDGTDVIGSSPAYFRRQFYIPGIPQDGAFDFDVDDDAQVFVNGTLVFNDDNGLATLVNDLGVTAQLRSGWNLMAIKAHDQQGAQSIAGQLDIAYIVPEPASGVIVVAGLLLLSSRRRRLRD